MNAKSQYKTRQREVLIQYFKALKSEHVSAADVCDYFKAHGETIGQSTVYRQLERLVDEGVINKYSFDPTAPACFEYVGEGAHEGGGTAGRVVLSVVDPLGAGVEAKKGNVGIISVDHLCLAGQADLALIDVDVLHAAQQSETNISVRAAGEDDHARQDDGNDLDCQDTAAGGSACRGAGGRGGSVAIFHIDLFHSAFHFNRSSPC